MELDKGTKVVSYALVNRSKNITMGKVKCSKEIKLQTVKYVLKGGKVLAALQSTSDIQPHSDKDAMLWKRKNSGSKLHLTVKFNLKK